MIDITSIIGDCALTDDAIKLTNPKQIQTNTLVNRVQHRARQGDQQAAEQLNILITALQGAARSFTVAPSAEKPGPDHSRD